MSRAAAAAAALVLAALALLLSGCVAQGGEADGRFRVVATTNFIADVAREIGGDDAEVTALMGPGVDPHLYKASAGDVETLRDADLVLYGGLELEGRLSDLFEELSQTIPTVAVTRDVPADRLRRPSEFAGKYDPHVWFSVPLWRIASATVADALAEADPDHAPAYRRRARAYLARLDRLDAWVRTRLAEVPPRSRVLVTSHDAFGYFGEEYGFEVVGIQGTSTQTEATTADVERVARIIADRDLRAVFTESAIPRQTIDAVLAAARRRGAEARVGGELLADAAGDAGTPEGTYIGMVRHNVTLIADGLR